MLTAAGMLLMTGASPAAPANEWEETFRGDAPASHARWIAVAGPGTTAEPDEGRVKVRQSGGPGGALLLVSNGEHQQALDLYPDHVATLHGDWTHPINATVFHTYRIAVGGTRFRLWIDGELVRDDPRGFVHPAFKGRNTVWFGATDAGQASDSTWEFVRYQGEGLHATPTTPSETVVIFQKNGGYACFPSLTQLPDQTLLTRFGTRTKTKTNNPHADFRGGEASYASSDGGRTWHPTQQTPLDNHKRRKDGGVAYAETPGWTEIPATERDEFTKKGRATIAVRPGVAAYLGGAYSYLRRVGETTDTRRPIAGTENGSLFGYGDTCLTRSGVRLTPFYGQRKPGEPGTAFVARSPDDGETWSLVPLAPPRITNAQDVSISFNETALVETRENRILALMRPNPDTSGHLYQSVSDDAGKTWSPPERTPMWGFPAHLLVLADGSVLCSYGYRRPPMGIRACLSRDGGRTWDIASEFVLRADGRGASGDVGYPRTTQLKDGTLVTVYYITEASGITHVAASRWRVPPPAQPKEQNRMSTSPAAPPLVLGRGAPAAGTYQAFPDACRLANGDIVVVFYAGYEHVSLPKEPDWPKGGRICLVRSGDEGRTWSEPIVIYDDNDDNRDPHIAQMPDGSLLCTFFSLRASGKASPRHEGAGMKLTRSTDNGKTWDTVARTLAGAGEHWYCSAPVRVLPTGTWLLGVYRFNPPSQIYGGVLRSTDNGKTWSAPIPIGKEKGIALPAETDVIALKDGTIFAALRGEQQIPLHYATSADDGQTWSEAKDIGFRGEAPYLYRMNSGVLLLAHRIPHTALHLSRDEGKTWLGPYTIDTVRGAYPSLVERKDGTALIVYYTEGVGSEIRARRFRILADGIEALPLDGPDETQP